MWYRCSQGGTSIRIPWFCKALVQAALAITPGGLVANDLLQRLNARRGSRRSILDARRYEIVSAIEAVEAARSIEGAVVVEVGTGWDALPTLCLSGAGAAWVHTFDHRRHLRHDLLAAAAASASDRWPSLRPVSTATSMESALHMARVSYTAPGDACSTGLPDRSADIFFSYAVLEHVSPGVALDLIREARRVLKPSGVFYALIGLHDHFNGFDSRVSRVNFLRFPEWLWRLLSKNRIAYHNRLRESDFLTLIRQVGGLAISVNPTVRPEDLAEVRAMRLDPAFTGYSDEDLATTRSEIIAVFPDLARTTSPSVGTG